LRGATVATMRGTEVIEDADIVVTHNRIVAVGATRCGTDTLRAHSATVTASSSARFMMRTFIGSRFAGQFMMNRMWDLMQSGLWRDDGLDVQPFSLTDVFAYET